jgi:hypothetical protein
MMETYYAYLRWCADFNERNLIDPAHDKMEWNHTLPQCIFGDQPIGQWLTLKQHAIASALQTLAFRQKCVCGWHKKYLSDELWNSCLHFYNQPISKLGREFGSENGKKQGNRLFEQSLGLFDPAHDDKKSEWAGRGVATQIEKEIGIHDKSRREEWKETYIQNGITSGNLAYENKKGLFDPENQEKVREGRSNGGKIGGKTAGAKTKEQGLGIFDPANEEKIKEGRRKGNERTNKQKWISTVDGFISTAAGVASHNRSMGRSGNEKIKLIQQ